MPENFKNIFIDRQFKHIRLFQDNMILLEKNLDKLPFKIDEWELIRASVNHDSDKFLPELLIGQMAIQEFFYNKRRNLSNEHINQNLMKEASKKHYENNTHHIEYHEKNNTEMSNINICEMCCDMAAMCQELGFEDYIKHFRENLVPKFKSLEKNQETFLNILNLLKSFNS